VRLFAAASALARPPVAAAALLLLLLPFSAATATCCRDGGRCQRGVFKHLLLYENRSQTAKTVIASPSCDP